MKARQGIYANDEEREDAWVERIGKQTDNVNKIDWDNYQIKDTYNFKLVPPILPARIADMDQLKNIISQYLCTNCCSHKVIRDQKTAPGCVSVIEVALNPRNEDVGVPPISKSH